MVGARRTFTVSPGDAWKTLLSEEGVSAWLGELPGFKLAQGAAYQLPDGTRGKVTVFTPGSHLRLTWQRAGYLRAAIMQVRVIPSGEKTTIAFHQEHLPDAAERAERGEYFRQALDRLAELIGNGE